MSANPFQTSELLKSISNYPISKGGDLPGHEFHGNQHTGGIGGGGSDRQSSPGRNSNPGRNQASTQSNGRVARLRDKLTRINHWGMTPEEHEAKMQEYRDAHPPQPHWTEMGKPGEVMNWRGKWVPANPDSVIDRALAMDLPQRPSVAQGVAEAKRVRDK